VSSLEKAQVCVRLRKRGKNSSKKKDAIQKARGKKKDMQKKGLAEKRNPAFQKRRKSNFKINSRQRKNLPWKKRGPEVGKKKN